MPKAEWTSRVERIDKPWGFETHFALVPGKYCGKTLHVDAGHALSLQYHVRKEETIAVQSGKLLFEVGAADGPLESFETAGRSRPSVSRYSPSHDGPS
jgi:mannose-6-phosphate isomerase